MKALTIRQPWAYLICAPEDELPRRTGAKRVENRSMNFGHRGPLLIHAGTSRQFLTTTAKPGGRVTVQLPRSSEEVPLERFRFGEIIGVADVVDSLPAAECRSGRHDDRFPWLSGHPYVCQADGRNYCLILRAAARFRDPVPARGMPGLFSVDGDVLAAVRRQLFLCGWDG